MEPNHEDSDQINQFYQWIRGYLADLSRSADGELSHAINFGYWEAGCKNLFDAEMAFFELILSMLSPLEQGDHGVEIGCGIGGYAARLLERCPVQLTCYDLLEEHLQLTRQFAETKAVAERLRTIQGNSMEMDTFSDDSLDFIYCVESSFHYDEKQKFFNEVQRVLKPGATFVYADISCEDVSKITFKSGNHFSAKTELDDYLKNANLVIVEHRDIGGQVYRPLQEYTEYFNDELLDAPAGSNKAKVGKYWDLVLNNYTKLFNKGLMGYQVYKVQKPEK
ncbi:MAG: methyltransferase domain-containing protein [Gammaproteobacteria bacterium]|nr:methyltransferase domain-containing protein [Gammaproteobacteria bacterium]